MSNPRYGNRSNVNLTKSRESRSTLGMSNGSIDSRISLSSVKDGNKQREKRMSVFLWTPVDVRDWLQKRHKRYYELYADHFREHDISGRALVRLDEMKLERMGVENREHRMDLREKILRLRIKHERTELKLLASKDKDRHQAFSGHGHPPN